MKSWIELQKTLFPLAIEEGRQEARQPMEWKKDRRQPMYLGDEPKLREYILPVPLPSPLDALMKHGR